MNCPYCLSENKKFEVNPVSGAYTCPVCKTTIPRGYVDQQRVPRSTVGVVGFSGHGKTVYLTSLFSVLGNLSSYWDGFYYRSLDDFTHKILYEQVPAFEGGRLPESTPANFPNPALINYNRLPEFGDAYLGFYDTAGEVFNDTAQISRAGYFVAHSDVVLFIVSIADCDPTRLDDEMSRLLDTYVRAVYDHLNVDLKKNQEIVVILSKADLISDKLPDELRDWFDDGKAEWYVMDLSVKLIDMAVQSTAIETWLRNDMHCNRFINMLRDNFNQVRYTLVSSTGFAEIDERGQAEGSLSPMRVLDPFFMILQWARDDARKRASLSTGVGSLWERIWGGLKGGAKKGSKRLKDTRKQLKGKKKKR